MANSDSPGVRPATQEAAGAGPRGKDGAQSRHVQVVNSVWNGSAFIKRKKADHLIREGRGRYIGVDRNQFLLDLSHPQNIHAARIASNAYESLGNEFQWFRGRSGAHEVRKAKMLPAAK